jgi:hypothetical protein
MARSKSQRRRILLDEFQYRLLAFNLLYFFILLVVMAAFLFVPLMIKLDNSALPMAEREEVADLILSLHATLWPAIAIVFILLAVHSVLVSHRIAGALYRFRCVFQSLALGNFTMRATLRKRDYLLKEAAELNAMIEAVGDRLAGTKRDCAGLQKRIIGLKASLQRGGVEACRRDLAAVDEQLERLRASLAQFTTADGRTGGGAMNGSGPSTAPAAQADQAKG